MVARVSQKSKRWIARLLISALSSPLILVVLGVLSPTPAKAEEGTAQIQEPSTPPTSDTSTVTSSSDSTTVEPVDSQNTSTGGETNSTQNASTEPSASEEVIQPATPVESTQDPSTEEAPAVATAETSTTSSQEVSSPPTVTEIVTPGGDDSSYLIPVPVSVVFNGVTYTQIYATTNSVITFGREDGTYWDYPITPSISIESKDWWALPNMSPDMWFIIRVSDGGFQVDGSYLPYGTRTGDTTQIVITGQIQTDGTVAYTYTVDGPLVGNERTGARLADGTVVTLEEAGVTKVEEPVVLAPEPVEPTPEPTPSLNAPSDVTAVQNSDGSVTLTWTSPAPTDANTAVERYAVSWSNGSGGWGVGSTGTSITLAPELFASTGGLNQTYNFSIRADNDTLAVYSATSGTSLNVADLTPPPPPPTEPPAPTGDYSVNEGGEVVITAPEGKKIASITAWYGDPSNGSQGADWSSQYTAKFKGETSATIQSGNFYGDPVPGVPKVLIFTVTYEDLAQAPVVPNPTPTEPQNPQPEPEPENPTPQPENPTPPPAEPQPENPTPPQEPVTPSQPSQPEEPTPTQPEEPTTPEPEEPTTPEPEIPVEEPEVVQPEEPVLPETPDQPEPSQPDKEEPAPVEPEQPEVEPSPEPTPESVIDDALADGKLTDEEKEAVVSAILEDLKPGEAVSSEQLLEAGLTYEDLPPETPVDVRTDEEGNPVIITAEVAAALVLLADPAALIGELFSDPGQVLLALGSIGADMSPQEREEAEKMVIAAVVAVGAAINAIGAAGVGGATSSGGSAPSGGGAPGGREGGARKPKTTRKTTPRKAK